MKTTARNITSCLALGLAVGILLTGNARAAKVLGVAPTGQSADSRKQSALQFLAQARQAMQQKQFDRADDLIRQADGQNVKFSMLNFGDSPVKARRDLDKLRGKIAKPSSRFMPFGAKQPPATDNPFANYNSPQPTAPPTAASTNFGSGEGGPSTGLGLGAAPKSSNIKQVQFGSSPATDQGLAPSQFDKPSVASHIEPLPKVNSFGSAQGVSPFGKPQVTSPPLARSPFTDNARQQTEFSDRQPAPVNPTTSPSQFSPVRPTSPAGAGTNQTEIGFVDRPAQTSQFRPAPAQPTSLPAFAQNKQRAVDLVRQARTALDSGDRPTARRLAQHAVSLQVPQSAFGPREDCPSLLMYDLKRAENTRPGAVRPAGGEFDNPPGSFAGTQADYQPQRDRSQNRAVDGFDEPADNSFSAPARQPGPTLNNSAAFAVPTETAMSLYEKGEQAFAAGDRELADKMFKAAWKGRAQLSPAAMARIKNYSMNPAQPPARLNPTGGGSLVDRAEAKQLLLARQLESDLMRRQRIARDQLKQDPKAALEQLKLARASVEASDLKTDYRGRLLRRVDRAIDEAKKYIAENRTQIELDDRNSAVLDEIDRERNVKLDVQRKLAEFVDQFNKLNRERRFREAELIVKKAEMLAPKNPLVVQLKTQATLIRNLARTSDIRERSQAGVMAALSNVDESGIPFNDNNPLQYGDINSWESLTNRRRDAERHGARRRTKKEYEIEQKLLTPVLMKFSEVPLREVVNYLEKVAGIAIYLEPRGLEAEGVESDTPITLQMNYEISLKSALNVILGQLQLGYVIEDEMLKVTSMSIRERDIYPQTYSVADLIIAIPNFGRETGMGLQDELQKAMNMATGTTGGTGMSGPMVAGGYAANPGSMQAHMNPTALGQVGPSGPVGASGLPGGLSQGAGGGAGQADFDSLMELITNTVAPTTWDGVGGPGSIAPFATNLSLVVNQTQEVHDQLVDLLKQLRRNQDLQVTIEVRFIDLSDNFFERIGVDFNFLAYDNIDNNRVPSGEGDNEGGPSMTVGFDGADITGDFEFNQGSFSTTIPSVGGVFSPQAAASFGFAVLSDIEAYFFVQAVQSDVRSNTLQAPKVTLFNGQQAFVTNSTQTPFVTSVIPVVGDFAAAHQPVIVVLTEGSSMTVQAVVSPDKRYVRLTVVPFFSKIDSVETFTFTGSETSSNDESEEDDEDGGSSRSRGNSGGRQGTTIQLPVFSFQTVTTTVTVPDGGTVLLGGLKSLREARNENGVPLLSKIPYINRLFKNVGIGRETRSLMMMVTPRIIILEEEEAKLLGTRAGP